MKIFVILLVIIVLAGIGYVLYKMMNKAKQGNVSGTGNGHSDQFDPTTVIGGGPLSVGGSSDSTPTDLPTPTSSQEGSSSTPPTPPSPSSSPSEQAATPPPASPLSSFGGSSPTEPSSPPEPTPPLPTEGSTPSEEPKAPDDQNAGGPAA